jgi:hypothetical protein
MKETTMNTMLKKFVIYAAAVLLVSVPMLAEEAGEGARIPRLLTSFEQAGAGITIPVTIDLTGVEMNSAPAVLGGYVVKATFDPAQVRFESATGGASPMFASEPVTTHAEKANAEGWVKVVGFQTNLYAPAGVVSVSSLKFTELVPGGGSSIRVELFEAVASPTPDREGKRPERIGLTPERVE